MVGQSYEADIIIGGIQCRALADTGAMCTSVTKRFYNKHLKAYELKKLDVVLNIEAADGGQVPYHGLIEIGISIPGCLMTNLRVPVLVVHDTPYREKVPVVIGSNVLDQLHEENVETKDSVWHKALQNLKHFKEKEKEAGEINIYSFHQIVVPPRQSIVVQGRAGAAKGFSSGVLQHVDTLPGGIILPEGAVCIDDGRVSMRLNNMSDRKISIPKGQKIGVLQQAAMLDSTDPKETKHEKTEKFEVPINLENTKLTTLQKQEVQKLVNKWCQAFARTKTELGTATGVAHSIKLTDDTPIKQSSRRIPPGLYAEVKTHIEDMLASGAIKKSNSPWSSNVVFARKKDGSLRLCLDFRKLNARTVQDAYHLPKIEETFDRLAGATLFSSLDLQSGYWQIPMKDEDKAKTAFSVGNLGFYECERMPFGLTNAPATFQRHMESCLWDLPFCLVYLDDIIVFSESFKDHQEKLQRVFARLIDCGLKLKPSKCQLFQSKVKYLGHIISEDGIETDPAKTEAISQWPIQKNVQELRQALGFFGYYRRFVKGYASIARPLHDLMKGHENTSRKNKAAQIEIKDQALEAFQKLKLELTKPPVLGFADFNLPFELHIDASQSGLGAVLYQQQEGKSRVIAYASRNLKPSEENYPAHKLEFLALKWAVCDKLHDYLYGHHCEVFTDNNPLSYILQSAKLDATGHRWLAELATFDFAIHYRPGKNNADADGMSRIPIPPEVIKALGQLARVEDAPSILEISCFSQQAVTCTPELVESGDYSVYNWAKLQQEDKIILQVIEILRKGHYDDALKTELIKQHKDFGIYLRDFSKLKIKNGILFRVKTVGSETVSQLVLPSSKREEALHGLHNDV